MNNTTVPAPPWMRRMLLGAAVYNVLWGAWAIIFPGAMFRLVGIPVPNYPELWQCIGMIVGVYGVGYAIAAFDPTRHWPIVFVGLLGKVLGPIGMLDALLRGAFPWKFALVCAANDLVWWVPFALVLRFAWSAWREEPGAEVVPAETMLATTRTTSGETLADMSRRAPVLLVFLRHSGCTFCREALTDIAASRSQIERDGTQISLVHLTDDESFRAFAAGYGLGDLPRVSDPERSLYRSLGLRRGTIGQLFGWRAWVRGWQAGIRDGHGVGLLKGDGAQMPGVFLVLDGRVVAGRALAFSGERPDYPAMCEVPRAVA